MTGIEREVNAMPKQVLLTGGTGLVGIDLLRELARKGYRVLLMSRRRPPTGLAHVQWLEADLAADQQQTLDSLGRFDFVVHAATVRFAKTEEQLAAMQRVNVGFTKALFEWAGERKVEAVVYISGLNFLRRPLESIVDESHPVAPSTPYAETKLFGETALAKHLKHNHFRGVSLRLSSPMPVEYGQLHETVVKKWIDRAQRGEPIEIHGRGERTQDFVATSDIAAAVVGAIESSTASGIYNVAAGNSLSMLELARLIARQSNAKLNFHGEDCNEAESWNISIEKTRRELGYNPLFTSRTAIERLLSTLDGG